MNEIRSVALEYFEAWRRKDAGGIAAHLRPDVRFVGPMARLEGRDAVLASFASVFPVLQDVVMRHLFVDGDRVVAVYDFVCIAPIGPSRMAEFLEFTDGGISAVEMFFDARPFEALSRAPHPAGQ